MGRADEAQVGSIILSLAAILAFAFGWGFVLLISAWRRTKQHRAALLHAFERIEELERMVSALTFGAAPEPAAPAEESAAAPARTATPALAAVGADAFIARLAAPAPHLVDDDDAPARDAASTSLPAPERPDAGPAALELRASEPPSSEPPSEGAAAPARNFPWPPAPALAALAARIEALPRPSLPRPRLHPLAAATGLLIAGIAGLALGWAGLVGIAACAGLAASAGLLAAALGHWSARREGRPAPLIIGMGLLLSGAGLGMAHGAALLAPFGSVLLIGALAGLGFLAAARHGPALGAVAAGMALFAPAFEAPIALPAWSSAVVLAAGSLGALFVPRVAGGGPGFFAIAAAMAGGAAAWCAAALLLAGPMQAGPVFLVLLCIAAGGLAHGWASARRPAWTAPALFGAAAMAGSLALAVFAAVRWGGGAPHFVFAGLASIVLLACAAAALRPRFAVLGLGAAALPAATLLWPMGDAPYAPAMLGLAALAPLLPGARHLRQGGSLGAFGASLMAFGPLAALLATQGPTPASVLIPGPQAGILAAALAAACYGASRLLRDSAVLRGVFVAGAVCAAASAAALATPAPWACVTAALCMPIIAYLDLHRPQLGLRLGRAVLGAALLAMLALFGAFEPSAWARAGGFLAVLASLALTARLLADAPYPTRALDVRALMACFGIAGALYLAMEASWGMAQDGRADFFFAAGVWGSAGLALACGCAFRFGPSPHPLLLALETALLTAGALIGLVLAGGVFHPWWGAFGGAADPWLALSAAFLAPALLCALYAWLRGRQGFGLRVDAALGAGIAFLWLGLLLAVRLLFHADPAWRYGLASGEGWALTAVTLGVAGVMVAAAHERQGAWLRHAGYLLALGALAKSFVLDAPALGGWTAAAAMIALAAASLGVQRLYRRRAAASPMTPASAEPGA